MILRVTAFVLLSAVVCAVFAVSIHILAYTAAPVGD